MMGLATLMFVQQGPIVKAASPSPRTAALKLPEGAYNEKMKTACGCSCASLAARQLCSLGYRRSSAALAAGAAVHCAALSACAALCPWPQVQLCSLGC